MIGVILYGPPASGKDTVTAELHRLDQRYRLFRRAKHGPGRTTGYRMITAAELDELRCRGEIVWENARYDATYVVDRTHLHATAAAGIVVLHLGQVQAVRTVLAAVPEVEWLTVELWCPRTVATQRIAARTTDDDHARLAAFDQTDRLVDADLRIDTGVLSAEQAAHRIHAAVSDVTK